MKDQFSRELEIFGAALKLTGAEAVETFLKDACGGDKELHRRVSALLQAHQAAGTFLLGPPAVSRPITAGAAADGETLSSGVAEHPGDRIGRYKLLQQIGEGGMGVVYMAEQEEPVRRRVALKIIKLGMDTRQVVARFEAERQALALMDHPNIAKVLDGGATDTGRPYFVMELVQGVPITEFCDKTKLAARERLKLFIQVCQAVQSAHQKGIIHRDIKPSNVLVTLHDGVPVPKVIDFGIAKATNQKLTEKTLFTNFATMIGTPAYMSPEQAEMSGLDIDTRTDIYALGVLLYALLTGTTPFPEKRLRSLGYGEMQRVILEEEPERPSTRLSTMANEQRTLFAQRCGEELHSLSKLLKGDLDWIVMKCLEKDRQRRYETATGLAADIQRHLSNEPVIARPPSAAYRLQKVVKRNRTIALATGAVAAALILALGFSTSAFLRERKARLEAAAAERAREEARRATEIETVRADTVARFVTSFFDSAIPDLAQRGHQSVVRRLLDVADKTASALSNAPLAEAEIRLRISSGYSDVLIDFAAERQQLLMIQRQAGTAGEKGRRLVELARTHLLMAPMWERQDTHSSKALREMAAEAMRRNPPDTETAADLMANLSLYTSYFGDSAEAELMARESLNLCKDNPIYLPFRETALDVLRRMLHLRRNYTEADKVAEQLLALLPFSDRLANAKKSEILIGYAETISDGGRFAEAERRLRGLLDGLPAGDTDSRLIIKACVGDVIARAGDWKRGLDMLSTSVTNEAVPVYLWGEAVHLASLLGNDDLRRSLYLVGLVNWAAGVDGDSIPPFVEPFLTVPLDVSMLPLLNKLVDRSLKGTPWTRKRGQLLSALLEYRSGHYAEAALAVEGFQRDGSGMLLKAPFVPLAACGWFACAAIKIRLSQSEAARDAFRNGLRLHSTALLSPGRPCTSDYFASVCAAELLRREAVALLGEQAPTAP